MQVWLEQAQRLILALVGVEVQGSQHRRWNARHVEAPFYLGHAKVLNKCSA